MVMVIVIVVCRLPGYLGVGQAASERRRKERRAFNTGRLRSGLTFCWWFFGDYIFSNLPNRFFSQPRWRVQCLLTRHWR